MRLWKNWKLNKKNHPRYHPKWVVSTLQSLGFIVEINFIINQHFDVGKSCWVPPVTLDHCVTVCKASLGAVGGLGRWFGSSSLTRVYGATRIVWVGGLFMDLPTGAIRNIDKTASKFLDSAKNCIKMICPEKCLATFCGNINSWPQCQPLINGCQLVKWLNKAPIS